MSRPPCLIIPTSKTTSNIIFLIIILNFFRLDGAHIVAAVGQEHRLGRWWRLKEARNSILVIPLNPQKVEEAPEVKED